METAIATVMAVAVAVTTDLDTDIDMDIDIAINVPCHARLHTGNTRSRDKGNTLVSYTTTWPMDTWRWP